MGCNMFNQKKEHEVFILRQFIEFANLRGEIVDDSGEAPDFIVKFDNQLVGIEITELFITDGNHNNSMQVQESFARRIVQKAQRLYTSSGARPVQVSVIFSSGIDLRCLNLEEAAKALSNFIEKKAPVVDQIIQCQNGDAENALPEAMAYIRSRGVLNQKMAHWIVASAGWVTPMTKALLQERIDKKARLLAKYKERVTTNWLILVAGGNNPSQFFAAPSATIAAAVSSPFTRTFYFGCMPRNVVELGFPQK